MPQGARATTIDSAWTRVLTTWKPDSPPASRPTRLANNHYVTHSAPSRARGPAQCHDNAINTLHRMSLCSCLHVYTCRVLTGLTLGVIATEANAISPIRQIAPCTDRENTRSLLDVIVAIDRRDDVKYIPT